MILSGKPFPIDQQESWTTDEIAEEFSKGGPSYRMFQYLREKGLSLHCPSEDALKKINTIVEKMGETLRLSDADKALLALAVDVTTIPGKKPIILTDDYSIQNIASMLSIKFQSVTQSGITKTFKWIRRCQGCGRILSDTESICPICGSKAKFIVSEKMKNQKKM